MKRVMIAIILGLAGSPTALPALADGGSPTPTPEPTASPTAAPMPPWYSITPAPMYTAGALPDGRTGKTLRSDWTGQGPTGHIDYWDPDGKAPVPGATDLDISAWAVHDSEKFVLSYATSEFTTTITHFADLVVLPPADASPSSPAPTVSLGPSDTLTIVRPPVPSSCLSAADPIEYKLMAAVLGTNGRKYLASIDVQFASRDDTAYAECRAKKAATTAPSNGSSGSSGSGSSSSSTSQGQSQIFAPPTSYYSAVVSTPLTDFVRGLLMWGIGIVLLLIAIKIWRQRERLQPMGSLASGYDHPLNSDLPLFDHSGKHIGGPTLDQYFALLPE